MINLGTFKENRILRACGAPSFRASVLRKRYQPDEAWRLLHRMWDSRSSCRRSQYVLLATDSGCLGKETAGVSDQVLLGNLKEGVRSEKLVVYMEWLSPKDFPVQADLHDDRWWMIPKGLFEQTAVRRQALPKEIKARLGNWFRGDRYDQDEVGPRLAGLRRYSWRKTSQSAGREFDFTKITVEELAEWAREAILEGEIAVYEELAKFHMRRASEDSPLTAAEYETAAKKYAQKYDISLGTAKPTEKLKPLPKADVNAPQIYETPTTTNPEALRNTFDDTCPTHNCRSESVESADLECSECFADQQNYEKWGNQVLGNEGGGGFLTSTTRVVEIPLPDRLWRYCGGDGLETGGWWSLTPLEGDPRVENALFPVDPKNPSSLGGTGEKLVACKITKKTKVLMGIGAPRCSNKPGGPLQVCFKRGTLTDPSSGVTLETQDLTKGYQ